MVTPGSVLDCNTVTPSGFGGKYCAVARISRLAPVATNFMLFKSK